MSDQILIGNFAKGLKLDRLPFNLDNDAFPTLYNFYIWRGRAKRKRGTIFLGRLERQVQMVANSTPPLSWQSGQLTLNGGSLNLFQAIITGITKATQAVVMIKGSIFDLGQTVLISGVGGMTQINGGIYTIIAVTPTTITLNVNSSGFSNYTTGGIATLSSENPMVTPGSISFIVGANTYTEPSNPDGTLIGTPTGTGSINYATGAVIISGGGSSSFTGTFSYFPGLPVLGLRDFSNSLQTSQFPLLLAFDETYAYQINQTSVAVFFYSVSFYKITNNPVIWDGADYQQFWTTNYSRALWATNNVPGLHFVNGVYSSGSGTTNITFTFTSNAIPYTNLIIGDQLWFNEWSGAGVTINGIVGVVSNVAGASTGIYVVTFPMDETVSGSGIAQLLTNTLSGQDGIRWYDGDPTNGTGLPVGNNLGWVNFAPPLTASTVSIANLNSDTYYLVGALIIVPFKDRIVFFSPWIQSSTTAAIQLKDTALWSWNGTPYYNSIVPLNETFNVTAYYVDQTGAGGYLPAGISQPIATVSSNEDALLVGFGGDGRKTRFVYTGNDLQPFLFFTINSELPSASTFSSISLDKGAIDLGQYGIAMTDQQSSQRIDLDIPDNVFQIQYLNSGEQRVNAIRDFMREWIYFSYPVNTSTWTFPTQTFIFNYRDNTWAVFYENFTAHGRYRPQLKNTWATIGQKFGTWQAWREPWNSGATSTLVPNIIAGNPQGYVLIKGQGTGEGISGTVESISQSAGSFTQIESVNHCVDVGDYLSFTGNIIGKVIVIIDVNNFVVDITNNNSATIINATNSTNCVLTIVYNNIPSQPLITSFFVGQTVIILGVVGMTQLNGNTYTILAVTSTTITLNVNSTGFTPYISGGRVGVSGYIGLSNFSRLSQPLLQTKQFPVYWDQGKKVRLGVQKYLMDFTEDGEVTVNIYLSQDPDSIWNQDPEIPSPDTTNNSLIYSQLMYTCPESTNIGLTPANTNLQMPTASTQKQIWHRFNTSLIGDSVQVGITLNDAQMRNFNFAINEITLHGIHLAVYPGPHLA